MLSMGRLDRATNEAIASLMGDTMREDYLKSLCRSFLTNPHVYSWSYQGLGMLRLNISRETRLQVWAPALAVPLVSRIHNHPWSFESKIVAGYVRNQRYLRIADDSIDLRNADEYIAHPIKCGPGGGMTDDPPFVVRLKAMPLEYYDEGRVYFQESNEIHESLPADGAVTIIRKRYNANPDAATVFTLKSEPWVSAEPRAASKDEIDTACNLALGWFK